MSKSAERVSGWAAAWSLSMALAFAWAGALRAEEPKCKCQTETVVEESYLPMLTRLPFVRQLFSVAPPNCNGPCCAEEMDHLIVAPGLPAEQAKRLGIFFDAASGPPARGVVIIKRFDLQQCAGEECAAACANPVAKQCTGDACGAETKVAATTKCCGEHCTCEAATAVAHGKATCPCRAAAFESLLKLTEKAAELAVEKAALEVSLEAQEDLAVLMMENARLEARLELHAKRDELAKEVQALAAENAHLKAQVELANHRTEITKQTLQLAIENERLKLKVAELERQNSDSSAARTARRD